MRTPPGLVNSSNSGRANDHKRLLGPQANAQRCITSIPLSFFRRYRIRAERELFHGRSSPSQLRSQAPVCGRVMRPGGNDVGRLMEETMGASGACTLSQAISVAV